MIGLSSPQPLVGAKTIIKRICLRLKRKSLWYSFGEFSLRRRDFPVRLLRGTHPRLNTSSTSAARVARNCDRRQEKALSFIAVDLGGSHADCALVQDGAVLAKTSVPIRVCNLLEPLLAEIASASRRLDLASAQGIGFGFPGLVDAPRCRVSSTSGKFIDAPDLDLAAWAQAELGLPLRLENDARLALLGECYAGAARGETDVVMFTLGTGIGGVAMIGGRLLRGKHGQAGVLAGHSPVNFQGRRCSCGALGCAESEASGWALPLVCQAWPGFSSSALAAQECNFENLFAAAEAGDPVALAIRDRCMSAWGAAAVAAIHAFDPEVLVYGGGVMKSAATIVPFIQSYVDRYAWTPWGKVRVCPALRGSDAALLGVVPLFSQEFPLVR